MRYAILAVLISSAALAQTVPRGPGSGMEEPPDRSRDIARAEQILRLGASTAPKDKELLFRILTGDVTPLERLAAIKALGPAHRAEAIVPLEKLIDDTDPGVALEATVVLHRFRPTPKTMARLEGFRDRGARLRGAFQTGEEHARPTYGVSAVEFFRKSAEHPLLQTRLDGALGLVELGANPRDEGLKVIREALSSTNPAERRTVVRVLNVQYDEPAFVALLDQAKRDPDEEIRVLAANILASRR